MTWIGSNLWLIPALPLVAAGLGAVCPRKARGITASMAIGTLLISFLLSCCALAATLRSHGEVHRETRNFDWLAMGSETLPLGWVLDPLSASMLVMVTFVGLLIFIYSIGYMGHDANFARFFCFLSLFAAAMLGVVISNSLLLLFICWELVGLASYLLIGFWYHKPEAATAARKAFIVTRIGDLGLFLGMLWLYADAGTLLFYDGGKGCLESEAISALTGRITLVGLAASTGIGLLIFCGAVGKSGQVPLHVWLPDAMEGPTPVSALIHAATMVAAGVFLVARVYPLMAAVPEGVAGPSTTLQVITWTGAFTALFAALIAVAQTDIKRILAYSTVSQLGLMMVGLGVGGVAVGMFHLLAHAFFKALLFLGAGSVIHGCHEEQDIRRMGGLRRWMPVTFVCYGVGMLALCGVPVFSGFWSKDEIIHSAWFWAGGKGPFLMVLAGAFLTAFYMTRQVCLVFFGRYRGGQGRAGHDVDAAHAAADATEARPHESPRVMTVPLMILAAFAVLMGFIGTPLWPWLQTYLTGEHAAGGWLGILGLMLLSTVLVLLGIGLGAVLYGWLEPRSAEESDPLQRLQPEVFGVLSRRFGVDEFYARTVVRWHAAFSEFCNWLDDMIVANAVRLVSLGITGVSWLSRLADEYGVNLGFKQACEGLRSGGGLLSRWQSGQVQKYLRVFGLSLVVVLLLLTWGWTK